MSDFWTFKWVIDAERVEASENTWEDMLYKQARIPALMAALAIVVYFIYDPPLWAAPAIAVWVAYTALPAIGSWHYYQEEVNYAE